MRPGTIVSVVVIVALAPSAAVPSGFIVGLGAPQTLATLPTRSGEGRSAISGVVIDGVTGRPIAAATVTIRVPGGPVAGGSETVGQQISDASGRFVFTRLRASDQCLIEASKRGYFNGGYGRETASVFSRGIVLADGQWFNAGNVKLWPPSAINGTVADERGEPVVGAFVRVLPRLIIAGIPQLVAGPVTTTDDRGVYRIAGLTAGQYVVSVPSVQQSIPTVPMTFDSNSDSATHEGVVRSLNQRPALDVTPAFRVLLGQYVTPVMVKGRMHVYPTTFFPSARSAADAAVITLGEGEDRHGIDIQWRPVPAFNVSGSVLGPVDALVDLSLRLVPKGSEGLGNGSEAATALVGAGGRFLFPGVPPGDYTIDASHTVGGFWYTPPATLSPTPLPVPPGGRVSVSGGPVYSAPVGTSFLTQAMGSSLYGARQLLSVEESDLTNVMVTLRPGLMLSGRIVSDVSTPPTAMKSRVGTTVYAEPAAGDPTLGVPRTNIVLADPAQPFTLEGLRPGEYFLRVSLSEGTIVKSIAWQNRDFTYRPFDTAVGENIAEVVITVTDKVARMSGTVRDARGLPVDTGAALCFPVEREQWTRFGFRPARIISAEITNGGSYRMSLPAGSYYLVAVGPLELDGWKDPAFLDAASRVATRITVDWGQAVTQDIALRRIR
jgi:hypothetical protein